MPTAAYVRVSMGGQSVESQRLAILDYAQRHGLMVQDFVEAHAAARQAGAMSGVGALLERLHRGDRLVVSEFARLGRSVGQIIQVSRLTGEEAEIQRLLAKTVFKASIAKILEVSRSTLHAFIQSRHLA